MITSSRANTPTPATEVDDDDFRKILAQTRAFVRTVVVPREQEIADADAIPDDIRGAAKEMGLFGYAIPQAWGGLGLNLQQDVELAMELGYTTLALRSMFGTNNGIAGQVLVNFGTDEQKSQWLEGIAAGEIVASFALTEPGAGSNPAGLRTRAVRDGRATIVYVNQRPRDAGVFTGVSGAPFSKKAIRLSAARLAMARRVGTVALAMCGVSTTLGTVSRSGCTLGSPSKTSRPAAAMRCSRRATARAASSTMPPRAMLISVAVGFISASSAAPMVWCDAGV